MKLAIIGGTGTSELSALNNWTWNIINTAFGEAEYAQGSLNGIEACFIPRHGRGHSIPPHMVNYRSTIAAAWQLGVTDIIASAAVGSLRIDAPPGSFAVLSDFLDMTRQRQSTFYDRVGQPVVHTDFTHPYCPELSNAVSDSCSEIGVEPVTPAVYLCVDGPRYETPAEIRLFRSWGADVVGMTNVPEVVLAREAGICYAAVAVVTNYASGISPTPLSHPEVVERMREQDILLSKLFLMVADKLSEERACSCRTNREIFGSYVGLT
jgi:5'-methylthioadenosine phosphorylase